MYTFCKQKRKKIPIIINLYINEIKSLIHLVLRMIKNLEVVKNCCKYININVLRFYLFTRPALRNRMIQN